MPTTSNRRRTPWLAPALVLALSSAACTGDPAPAPAAPPAAVAMTPSPSAASPSGSVATPRPTAMALPAATPAPTTTATAPPPLGPSDGSRELALVRRLAAGGPREATSDAYARAAALVERRFRDVGWRVRRQPLPVPAGVSWGVEVPAGETENLIATRPDFDPGAPHVVVGAHLDTVPQSPGAEDDASGIAVLVELARRLDRVAPRVPVVLVAYGAEEPRGPGDSRHHYGSRVHVSRMPQEQRDAVVGMLTLDRVGVGTAMPVCDGGLSSGRLVRQLLAAAERKGIRTVDCGQNRSGDHWSFEKAGIEAARLGSTSWAGYHSPDDLPKWLRAAQIARATNLAEVWVRGLRP